LSLLRKRVIDIGGLLFDEQLMTALGLTSPKNRRERGALFYVVLWGAAEDWGGYEPNYRTLAKQAGHLNITTDEAKRYVGIFIREKKIVPFETEDGREIHWLVNFLRHQTLNTPKLPSLPLPEWITYEVGEYRSGRKYAKYKVLENKLPESLCSLQGEAGAVCKRPASSVRADYRNRNRNRNGNYKGREHPGEDGAPEPTQEGASGPPPSDEEKEREEYETLKPHIQKQCGVLMSHFGIQSSFDPQVHKGSRFHPVGFVYYARKSSIPARVIVKVLDSMVRQKENIANPYGWLTSVLASEFQEYSYTEELKEHEQRKRWGLSSISSFFRRGET
jgi:hypothetical protein